MLHGVCTRQRAVAAALARSDGRPADAHGGASDTSSSGIAHVQYLPHPEGDGGVPAMHRSATFTSERRGRVVNSPRVGRGGVRGHSSRAIDQAAMLAGCGWDVEARQERQERLASCVAVWGEEERRERERRTQQSSTHRSATCAEARSQATSSRHNVALSHAVPTSLEEAGPHLVPRAQEVWLDATSTDRMEAWLHGTANGEVVGRRWLSDEDRWLLDLSMLEGLQESSDSSHDADVPQELSSTAHEAEGSMASSMSRSCSCSANGHTATETTVATGRRLYANIHAPKGSRALPAKSTPAKELRLPDLPPWRYGRTWDRANPVPWTPIGPSCAYASRRAPGEM